MEFRPVNIQSEPSDQDLIVGIANLKVHISDIVLSIDGTPRVNLSRYVQIVKLLNQAIKKESRVDLLILPEVSIPHQMIPLLQRFCRTRQLAIVTGIEHRNDSVNNTAYNEVAVIIPYQNDDDIDACRTTFRLKRYYSPEETRLIESHLIDIPDGAKSNDHREDYHIFRWKGAAFSVINCYELTNIKERSEFRGKIDFLVAVEWNPDTTYFSNIAESTARDIHCFFIQVNTSDYGDSRIVAPQKTAKMNWVRVKGGNNTTLLTCPLPISKLREFQRLSDQGQKDSDEYKLTPADFDRSLIPSRYS